MASNIEKKYVDALETFTESLDEIVKLLQSQVKTGKANPLNDFLKTPMGDFACIYQK